MPRPFRYDRFPSRPRSRAARARWPLFVTTLAWLCAAAAVAQTPTGTPGIPEAMARLNAGDAAGASRILEGVVARSPDNARAWRALGQVARQAGQLDRALQAYVRADFANPFVEPVQIIHEWVGEGINDQFGWIARNIGDVDGDGVNDVVTSAPTKQINGTPAGRLYVYSSRSGRLVWRDGDGHDDLIVGAWQHASGAVSGGRATLFSGKDGRVRRTYTCRIPGDTFGFDAVGLGDVDGDGTIDLLITSAWSGVAGFHSGRVFVISSGVKPAGR